MNGVDGSRKTGDNSEDGDEDDGETHVEVNVLVGEQKKSTIKATLLDKAFD